MQSFRFSWKQHTSHITKIEFIFLFQLDYVKTYWRYVSICFNHVDGRMLTLRFVTERAAKRGKTAKVKPDAADSSSESAAGSSSEGSAASSDEEGSVTDKSDTSSELSSEFGVQGGSFITTVKPDAAGPTTMPVAEVEWWEELDEEGQCCNHSPPATVADASALQSSAAITTRRGRMAGCASRMPEGMGRGSLCTGIGGLSLMARVSPSPADDSLCLDADKLSYRL